MNVLLLLLLFWWYIHFSFIFLFNFPKAHSHSLTSQDCHVVLLSYEVYLIVHIGFNHLLCFPLSSHCRSIHQYTLARTEQFFFRVLAFGLFFVSMCLRHEYIFIGVSMRKWPCFSSSVQNKMNHIQSESNLSN